MSKDSAAKINEAAIQFYLAVSARQVAQGALKRSYLTQRHRLGIHGYIDLDSPEFGELARATDKEFVALERAKRRERYTKSKLMAACRGSIAGKLGVGVDQALTITQP